MTRLNAAAQGNQKAAEAFTIEYDAGQGEYRALNEETIRERAKLLYAGDSQKLVISAKKNTYVRSILVPGGTSVETLRDDGLTLFDQYSPRAWEQARQRFDEKTGASITGILKTAEGQQALIDGISRKLISPQQALQVVSLFQGPTDLAKRIRSATGVADDGDEGVRQVTPGGLPGELRERIRRVRESGQTIAPRLNLFRRSKPSS